MVEGAVIEKDPETHFFLLTLEVLPVISTVGHVTISATIAAHDVAPEI